MILKQKTIIILLNLYASIPKEMDGTFTTSGEIGLIVNVAVLTSGQGSQLVLYLSNPILYE